MSKYIDAEKLKYEIERRKLSNYHTDTDDYEAELFEIIDSLQQEQPEVDLKEEVNKFSEKMPIQEHKNIFEGPYQTLYELGLNAKKED